MSSTDRTSDTAGQMVPAPVVPFAEDLTVLDSRELTTQFALANETYAATLSAHNESRDALGGVLTEKIARRILTVHPTSYMIQVRTATEYHYDPESGDIAEDCTGHDSWLVPCEVLTEDGTILGRLDALDPVCYWLERLTPLLEAEEAVLLLHERVWAFGVAVAADEDTDED